MSENLRKIVVRTPRSQVEVELSQGDSVAKLKDAVQHLSKFSTLALGKTRILSGPRTPSAGIPVDNQRILVYGQEFTDKEQPPLLPQDPIFQCIPKVPLVGIDTLPPTLDRYEPPVGKKIDLRVKVSTGRAPHTRSPAKSKSSSKTRERQPQLESKRSLEIWYTM